MLATLKHGWLQFYRDEEGQELITWIIIAALGVAAVIGIWKFLMPKIKGVQQNLGSELDEAGNLSKGSNY